LQDIIAGFVLKVYNKDPEQLFGSTQDQDTLIKQSPNYSNRAFSVSVMEFTQTCLLVRRTGIYTYNEVHIGLFESLLFM